MSTRRYKFRKDVELYNRRQNNRKTKKQNQKKISGGSRASEYVLAPLKTGCSYDVSHLQHNVNPLEQMNLDVHVYKISGGAKNKNKNRKNRSQSGGEHQARLDAIPEFLRDNMSAVEPGRPQHFIANSNLPEPNKCLQPELKYMPINEKVNVELSGFPEEGIPQSNHHPFKEEHVVEEVVAQEQKGGMRKKSKSKSKSKSKINLLRSLKKKNNKRSKNKSACQHKCSRGGRRKFKSKTRRLRSNTKVRRTSRKKKHL
tara:strand:+ start:1192 stop:1962 length:771 start_codon:yes stop_codon:yes gene_type:complete